MAKKVSDRLDAKGSRLVSLTQEDGRNFALALTYKLGEQSPILDHTVKLGLEGLVSPFGPALDL